MSTDRSEIAFGVKLSDLLDSNTGLMVGDTSAPTETQIIGPNSTVVIWGDPLSIGAGASVVLRSGAQVILETEQGTADPRQLPQSNADPSGSVLINAGWYCWPGLNGPFTIESRVSVELAPGAMLDLNPMLPGVQCLWSQRLGNIVTGSGDLNLFSLTIPPNTLGTARGIRVKVYWRQTTGSGQITGKPKYGGTRLDAGGSLTSTYQITEFVIYGDGSTSAQRGYVTKFTSGGSVSFTRTTAIDQTVATVVSYDVALSTTTDQVTADFATVELLN